MDIKLTPEQKLQLTILFAQQDVLNEIVLKYNEFVKAKGDQEVTVDSLKGLVFLFITLMNEKQKAIDTQINQIQSDVKSNLN